MKFGLFSNGMRKNPLSLGAAWDLDIAEAVTADQAGMDEAWFSEHWGSADLLVARAAETTKNIRVGSAVRVLPAFHPAQVLIDTAVTDQLSHGRYMLGVGRGGPRNGWAIRGIEEGGLGARFKESLDLILTVLRGDRTSEPWNPIQAIQDDLSGAFASSSVSIENEFWSSKGLHVGGMEIPSFIQKNIPVAVAVGWKPESAFDAGVRGLGVLTADFMRAESFRAVGDAYVRGLAEAGYTADRNGLRACRMVYVADTDEQAREELGPSYQEMLSWETKLAPHHHLDRSPDPKDATTATFQHYLDTNAIFVGSPATVTELIENYYEESGGFGTLLLHTGRDYATPELMNNSLRLFMSEVAPKVAGLTPEPA